MRQPRNTDPRYIRHISIRTEGAMLLLLPEALVNEIVGGVLARYQEAFSVLIYAYSVLGNHIHMLARAPHGNLWAFEQAVNREAAKRINRLRNIRGHFWERRYDEQIAPEDSDALEAFLYVTCNAVSHGLVQHPMLWPGLCSYTQTLDGRPRTYRFVDYTAYGKACRRAKGKGKRVNIKDFETEHTLTLTPLPQFEQLSHAERRKVLTKLICERVERIKKERKQQGKGFLGRDKVLQQKWNSVPREVKRLKRPLCYTKNWETKKHFMAWYFPWLETYREASRRYRSGERLVQFPDYCLMPPHHYS
jgi:putative transposase